MSIPQKVHLFEELSMGVEGLRRVSGCLVTLLGMLPFLGTIVSADEPQRPNVIVFVADDLAWDDLGCYGHPTIRTPSIDRLAERGMRYDAAFLTCSSCSPSRSSMLTGRYPNSTGAAELHPPLPADAVRSPSYVEMLLLHERGELDEIVADVFRVPRSPEELYLWRDDPYCTKNAVERAELSPLRDELREALEGWREETGDRFPGAEQLPPDKYDRRTGRLPDKP